MNTVTWNDLEEAFANGEPVRYWGRYRGYTYGTFIVTRMSSDSLSLTIPSGDPIKVSRKDFEKIEPLLDDYQAGRLTSDALKQQTGRSAYIFSLVHEVRSRRQNPQRTVGDILDSNTRIFLKSEYGPVSQLWPAVSFSRKQYADQLSEDINAEKDLVLFAGTLKEPTAPEARGRLMCLVRVQSGPAIDSGLVVDAEALASFQRGDSSKFAYSLPASLAWSFTDLPEASKILGEIYSKIGQGNARQSYLEVDFEKIRLLSELRISPIPLSIVPLNEFHLRESEDELSGQLNRVLAGLLSRAQQSDSVQSHRAPIRIVDLDKEKLRIIWERQNGLCQLCGAQIYLATSNPLLRLSADRIDNDNGRYDLSNVQLTHLACNLGRNAGTNEQFHEWLRLTRTIER